MRVGKLLATLCACIQIFIPLSAASTRLTPSDVQRVMGQFFDYHIDKKKMTVQLLDRSLKIYVSNFDPARVYFLEREAHPFVEPSQPRLRQMLSHYDTDRFDAYFTLNKAIERSILRARAWREEWEADPVALVAQAREISLTEEEKKPSFVRSEAALKERHRSQFLKLIYVQVTQLQQPLPEGKEATLVALCEKHISQMENSYLGRNDQGEPLSEERQQHNLLLRILKALAHSLDSHTAYYSPEEAHAMKVQLEKGMCGIGVVLREGLEGIDVVDVVKGGPAAKKGALEKGDTIIEVDGESIQGYSFPRVLQLLRGGEGTKTVLGILRSKGAGQAEFQHIELVRSKIALDDKRVDVSSEPHKDGIIGKITLHSFYEGKNGISSEKDLRQAISQLREQGPLHGLVLDMRDNGGGFLSQAVRVSGLFISGGVVVISKYSDGSVKFYRSVEGERFYDGPLVILVSKGSASATEIVTQTLQDYGIAIVVGDEQTYGKGTIQHQTVTSDSTPTFFKVTIGRYYTVSGKSTQIDGVKADIVVPTALHHQEFGEAYLDYPLPRDHVAAAYHDTLADIDPYARKWFARYYLPIVQPRLKAWRAMLPTLKENSKQRLATNQEFQTFLQSLKKQIQPIAVTQAPSKDLQMEEATHIVKDMIYLQESSPLLKK